METKKLVTITLLKVVCYKEDARHMRAIINKKKFSINEALIKSIIHRANDCDLSIEEIYELIDVVKEKLNAKD